MKLSSIFFAALGFGAFVNALPAPSPALDTGVDLLEKRELISREPVMALEERTSSPDLVADVQVCIDAVVAINKKYNDKKSYSSGDCKSWASEIIIHIKLLITVISSYPKDCVYPSVDVCVSIFVKLFVAIFVQLKVFIDLGGGLIGTILLTVDLLLAILLGLVADLLNICVSLCILIEAKIKVGICAKIISGCGGLINGLYLSVFIKLLVKAGISL